MASGLSYPENVVGKEWSNYMFIRGLVFFFTLFSSLFATDVETKWVVYFADKEPISAFKPYEWVVLDRFQHPPVRPLVDQRKLVFGYINLGETEEYTPWFQEVKQEDLLLEENKNWPGSHMVDLRNPKWAKRVIEQIIPFILFKGFNGLFLDTLDNATYLEQTDPEAFSGMQEAAVQLVRAIRQNYPEIKLMVNRGLDIAEELAPYIDFLLGEVIFTSYNFEEKTYTWKTTEEQAWGIERMKKAQAKNPKLQLLSLDYWNPKDKRTIQKIYQKARMEGFAPYVATVELDQIVPEPS